MYYMGILYYPIDLYKRRKECKQEIDSFVKGLDINLANWGLKIARNKILGLKKKKISYSISIVEFTKRESYYQNRVLENMYFIGIKINPDFESQMRLYVKKRSELEKFVNEEAEKEMHRLNDELAYKTHEWETTPITEWEKRNDLKNKACYNCNGSGKLEDFVITSGVADIIELDCWICKDGIITSEQFKEHSKPYSSINLDSMANHIRRETLKEMDESYFEPTIRNDIYIQITLTPPVIK